MPIVSDLLFELETVARPGFNIENKYSIARFSLLSPCGYRSVSVCQESIQQACLRKMLRNKWCKSFTSVCFQCVRIELKCLIFASNRKFSKRLQKKKKTQTGAINVDWVRISQSVNFNAFENKCPRRSHLACHFLWLT